MLFSRGAFGSRRAVGERRVVHAGAPAGVPDDLGAARVDVHEREALEVHELPAVVAEVVRGDVPEPAELRPSGATGALRRGHPAGGGGRPAERDRGADVADGRREAHGERLLGRAPAGVVVAADGVVVEEPGSRVRRGAGHEVRSRCGRGGDGEGEDHQRECRADEARSTPSPGQWLHENPPWVLRHLMCLQPVAVPASFTCAASSQNTPVSGMPDAQTASWSGLRRSPRSCRTNGCAASFRSCAW